MNESNCQKWRLPSTTWLGHTKVCCHNSGKDGEGWVWCWERTPLNSVLSEDYGEQELLLEARELQRFFPQQHTPSQNDGIVACRSHIGQVYSSGNIKPLQVFQHLIATFTLRPQKWVLGGLQDVLSYSCSHSTQKAGWTWQGRILKQ